ncbi:probable inactive histone-lysine N-methyltransferase SUVR2 isoform X1 [Rhododendron vialii]|uniref:probable inactive histone-lysine N-methyltransferase SUVR2 isoform X1 n=1 Tax=Rhododendron vialii TaxID=182163 RepID=UPI00265E1978|nr:probable inactive histone-lysine N-methyltransferase SUVR2 isoform X1 [Rhododendron vialii]XP_058207903.1 probable inactive histone-lysine N-methyltransferase SUVR2 isoform X1 [Rhododendron vialii]XP_058207911.1 probable inactive histone-lysine N-methyltransferase SUVR2 isoform X1 [Rhododendron vialii]XP_058207920.1 probable inactive histone-lysine N-methyltransferase SUVR2 isoform X1 [Rhododendron vialii]XP_058207929.1 probable inactive histone-lysine N-methyltransferase SUVR2 isoform X1 [R
MPTNPKVTAAFRAMRSLGIAEDKVKPVLKNLLKLYEKNWALIEEENYRALADAIFDQEEALSTEQNKRHENADQVGMAERKKRNDNTDQVEMDDEEQVNEEPERPLKRLRLRYHEAEDMTDSSQPYKEHTGAGTHPSSPQPLTRNKGKQPVSPKPSSDLASPPIHLRGKGKEPLYLQTASGEKKTISGRSPQGVVPLPKQVQNSLALIKPKDEPFTEDMPQFEVPLAVVHPAPLSIENPSSRNGLIRKPGGPEPLVSRSRNREDRSDGLPSPSTQRRNNHELANVEEEFSSHLDIASSPAGEVKISLTCNPAHGRPGFHIPSIEAVVKMVEDRCLRSYKVVDPSFCVMKIMKDMCDCFLELGTDSVNESHERIDVTADVDLLKQFNPQDSLVCGGKSFDAIAPTNAQGVAEAEPLSPRLLLSSNGTYDCAQTENTVESNYEVNNKEEHNGLDHANAQSLVVVRQCEPILDELRLLHNVNDIARGEERVTVSLVNKAENEPLPAFLYIPRNVVFQTACVNYSLARIGESCCPTCFGDCLLWSTPCACAHDTAGSFAYTLEGLVKEDLLEECISMHRDAEKNSMFYCKECPLERIKNDDIPEACKGHLSRKFIKECWWKCGCNKQCGNRVVQRGLNCSVQVFMTPEGKGWGLRTLQDLPKGAFVCEYVGEILTNAELSDRISKSPNSEGLAYLVLLDANWGSGGVLKDEEALCLDATNYGNVARFINHRCFDPNLVEIPVEVETPDHRYYRLAFFTTRKVEAFEELTWDYGIDFDDSDHPVKAFRCQCGSEFCRNIKRSSRSRSSANEG